MTAEKKALKKKLSHLKVLAGVAKADPSFKVSRSDVEKEKAFVEHCLRKSR